MKKLFISFMKKVCYRCHSPQWADNYFDEFDKVVSDYNMLWAYTDNLYCV